MYAYCTCMYTMIVSPQLTSGGAAEKDGRLSIGNRILEVNGVSLLGATHIVAVRALRNNPMEVSLLVSDGYDPREVVRMKLEQEQLSVSNMSATLDTSSLSSEGESLRHWLQLAESLSLIRVTFKGAKGVGHGPPVATVPPPSPPLEDL